MLMKKSILTLTFALLAVLLSTAGELPKYIFYCIGDGMGMPQVIAADSWLRSLKGENDTVSYLARQLAMMQMPVSSWCTTRSYNSDVTDSAAAGTALATGVKTRNSMLGMNPDTIAVPSIAQTLKEQGYGIGLVTSVAPDDATPAAFYAHVPNRGMYYDIGRQAIDSDFEFIGGSAWRGETDRDGKPTDLADRFAEAGIARVHNPIELAQLPYGTRRVTMVAEHPFNNSNVGFTIDSIPEALTLAELTWSCLSHLQRVSPDRFFMMVEGGNIDHAAHANDAATVIVETAEFDNVIRQLLAFYAAHPDETLIIVTADHETGGMSIGNNHTGYAANYAAIAPQRMSKTAFEQYLAQLRSTRTTCTPDDMRDFIRLNIWPDMTDDDWAELLPWFERIVINGEELPDQQTLYGRYNPFAVMVYDRVNERQGFGWTTLHHTGAPVPVFAIGVGAGRFSGPKDNTDLIKLILN